jgi:hypothetical protein
MYCLYEWTYEGNFESGTSYGALLFEIVDLKGVSRFLPQTGRS